MSEREGPLPALGRPDKQAVPEEDDDFASEHDNTTVDEAILADTDDRETESPRGWAGLERRDLTAD